MKSLTGQSINANKIEGLTTLTGRLHFYEDGLVFKALSVNSILNLPRIEYKRIVSVKKRKTLGIIPNGIIIELDDGTTHIYVVNNRKAVISYLASKIYSAKGLVN